MEVCNTVQDAKTEAIPRKKKMQEGKVVVWGDCTHSWEKKRGERRGRMGRLHELNAEFQRIGGRDKASLSDQCKEIEENNGVGKTRDLFKQTGDTRGTFCEGWARSRTGMVRAWPKQRRVRRGGINAQNCTKKGLNALDDHDGVVTHLGPDILEYEVKWASWALLCAKSSECDGIPAELFQVLKDGAVKVLHSVCEQI